MPLSGPLTLFMDSEILYNNRRLREDSHTHFLVEEAVINDAINIKGFFPSL